MIISSLRFRPIANKLHRIISGITLLVSLVACHSSLTSVAEIDQQQIDRIVSLTGKVIHVSPLIDLAAYQIEDATGKIWVVTTQKLPELGQPISIKGQIKYQSLPFATQELGELYLVELEQLPIPPDKE